MMKKIRIISVCIAIALLLGAVIGITVAADNAPSVEIFKKNVSYDDSLQLVYAVEANNAEGYQVKVLFSDEAFTAPAALSAGGYDYAKSPSSSITLSSVTYPVAFSNGVNAKEMRKPVYAIPVLVDGDAVVASGEMVEYSLYTYAMERFDGSATEEQLTLYTALLDYGAAVQAVLEDQEGIDTYGWADAYYIVPVTKTAWVKGEKKTETSKLEFRPSDYKVIDASESFNGKTFMSFTDEAGEVLIDDLYYDGAPFYGVDAVPGTNEAVTVNYGTATRNDTVVDAIEKLSASNVTAGSSTIANTGTESDPSFTINKTTNAASASFTYNPTANNKGDVLVYNIDLSMIPGNGNMAEIRNYVRDEDVRFNLQVRNDGGMITFLPKNNESSMETTGATMDANGYLTGGSAAYTLTKVYPIHEATKDDYEKYYVFDNINPATGEVGIHYSEIKSLRVEIDLVNLTQATYLTHYTDANGDAGYLPYEAEMPTVRIYVNGMHWQTTIFMRTNKSAVKDESGNITAYRPTASTSTYLDSRTAYGINVNLFKDSTGKYEFDGVTVAGYNYKDDGTLDNKPEVTNLDYYGGYDFEDSDRASSYHIAQLGGSYALFDPKEDDANYDKYAHFRVVDGVLRYEKPQSLSSDGYPTVGGGPVFYFDNVEQGADFFIFEADMMVEKLDAATAITATTGSHFIRMRLFETTSADAGAYKGTRDVFNGIGNTALTRSGSSFNNVSINHGTWFKYRVEIDLTSTTDNVSVYVNGTLIDRFTTSATTIAKLSMGTRGSDTGCKNLAFCYDNVVCVGIKK